LYLLLLIGTIVGLVFNLGNELYKKVFQFSKNIARKYQA
jgi:hypothetical protein